jgi:hypothetical protein
MDDRGRCSSVLVKAGVLKFLFNDETLWSRASKMTDGAEQDGFFLLWLAFAMGDIQTANLF